MSTPHVRTFGSLEEMQAYMAGAEKAANEGLRPEQIALRDAIDTVWWIRPYPEMSIMIFGETFGPAKQLANELEYIKDGLAAPEGSEERVEAEREAAYYRQEMPERRARGYLSGRAYSVIEPRGEIGDTHVANAWPISREAFEQARELDWNVRRVLRDAPNSPLARDIRIMIATIR